MITQLIGIMYLKLKYYLGKLMAAAYIPVNTILTLIMFFKIPKL